MPAAFTNENEFRFFFREYYPKLYSYGYKIIQQHEALEDCLQELFTEIWRNTAKTDIKSMNAYLYKSLQYKLFKHLAKEKKLATQSTTDFNYPFEINADTLLLQEEENTERVARVIKLMEHLSARQREIIYLKFYKYLSYEEISEIMQISYQAARNLLSLSLKTLRKAMQEN